MADAVADALDTDDMYIDDDPFLRYPNGNKIQCWQYTNQEVTVSYNPTAGRVSTFDYGIDKCFYQFYTEKSLNSTDKIITILNSQLEALNEEIGGLRDKLETTNNARCAPPTSASKEDSNWNFWGACFFTMTLATTIGYVSSLVDRSVVRKGCY
jgi:hypothetical protein